MDKIKEFAKYLIFIELLVFMVILAAHLVLFITGEDLTPIWHIYWVMPSIVFGSVVFGTYVIEPIADWYFKLWDK